MDHYEAVDAWLYNAFMPDSIELVSGIRSLGTVLAERQRLVPSHDGVGAISRTYIFENLQIFGLTNLTDPERARVSGIEITGPGWTLVNGLGVGSETANFRAQLGIRPGESLRYCGINNCLVAEEAEGRITKITICLYVD